MKIIQRLRHWRYTWAIVPMFIVAALSLNNHLYYFIFNGYDMPMHFLNAYTIQTTGSPPTPQNNLPENYEAHQAPIYYILAAWTFIVGDPFVKDSIQKFAPAVLFVLDLVWVGIMVNIIDHLLRRSKPLTKALTLLVVMLLPMHVMVRGMFGNDLPELLFGTLAIVSLWRLVRTGRETERDAWLRAAALCGFAIAFKNNGIIFLGTYLALFGFILMHEGLQRRRQDVIKTARGAVWGIPLMIIPFAVNNIQTLRFINDPIGAMGVPPIEENELRDNPLFLRSFDTSFFEFPFAYFNGQRGYWSLEYVTLHSDYYNQWSTVAYSAWDKDLLMPMPHRDPMPISRFTDLQNLQVLAIPVTLVMVFAFLYACYRCIFRWCHSVRDGSALVVIFTVVANAAQITRYLAYPDVNSAIIHARYIGFMWFFLFIVGIYWLAKLGARRNWFRIIAGAVMIEFAIYCFISFRAMWLPPI